MAVDSCWRSPAARLSQRAPLVAPQPTRGRPAGGDQRWPAVRLGGEAVGDHRHKLDRAAGLPGLDAGSGADRGGGPEGWPATTQPEGLTRRLKRRWREPASQKTMAPPGRTDRSWAAPVPPRDRGDYTALPGASRATHLRKSQPGNYRNRFAAPAFLPWFFTIRCTALQWFAIALECERRREKAYKTRPFGSPSQAGCRGFESLRPLFFCRGRAAKLLLRHFCRSSPRGPPPWQSRRWPYGDC